MINIKSIQVLIGSVCLCAGFLLANPANSESISIVGSSTVYPFATAVAEEFGAFSGFSTPTIESTGSGGGLKLFCAGIGNQHPDITNASRKIKSSEIELCKSNGVTEISEVMFGYDGIVFANAKASQTVDISRKELFLALAAKVPSNKDGSGNLLDNPYKYWSEINPSLPKIKIEVLGPPPTSGTRDAFVELVMHKGCEELPAFANLSKKERKKVCSLMREDGAYIDAGENDNLIIQKLEANPSAFGIFGYSFLAQNKDKLNGNNVEGNLPSFENISSGAYPVSRSLFFYVKDQHIPMVPGLKEYVAEFLSENASGAGGYLEERGLIPLNDAARDESLKKLTKFID